MSDIKHESSYDSSTDTLIVKRSQDVEPFLEQNKIDRNSTSETGKYKGNLVKAASFPPIVVEMMMKGQCCSDGKKYNILSPDPDERRRALVHAQTEHNYFMSINGNPFTKNRIKWA